MNLRRTIKGQSSGLSSGSPLEASAEHNAHLIAGLHEKAGNIDEMPRTARAKFELRRIWTAVRASVTLRMSLQSLAEDLMSLQTHLAELTERHKLLDRKIVEQLSQPSVNDAEIARLKREKLKIKDRISQIKI